MNTGKAFTILDSSGKPIGRGIPRKEPSKGFAATFTVDGQLVVRAYGPLEMGNKMSVNGWTTAPSYLTVTRVVANPDNTVSVTLMHNAFAAWNQLITVPFSEDWKKAVTARLIELNNLTGSETHIANFSDLTV